MEGVLMRKHVLTIFGLLLLAILLTWRVNAQYNSSQSYKHGPATSQSVTSAAAGTAIDVTGYSYVMVQYKGTYTTNATSAGFQVSIDDGVTYINQVFYVMGTASPCLPQTVTGDLTDNSTNVFMVPVAGFTRFRTNALNWASGTISVYIEPIASPAAPCSYTSLATALTSASDSVAADVTKVGGTAVGNANPLYVRPTDGTNNMPMGDASARTIHVTPDSVPADPFGANADAASATGSVSAKLRFIAATGIPITGVPTDPFGANADSASATGSISAKLRFISATGIPITSVPADPFGANADAASATGSISAKLRFIAATGIPITTIPSIPTGSNQIGHLEANQSVNVAQINGVTPLMGNGATGTGSQRVTISDNQTPFGVIPTPGTSGGLSLSATQSAASTNSTSVKGSAGQVFHIHAINTTATLYYLRLYNSSSAPTCSSSTGFVMTIPIPASATGAGVVIDTGLGFAFSTGIGFCLTGGGANNDNTNAATGVYVNIGYK